MDQQWTNQLYAAALETTTSLVLELVRKIPQKENFKIQSLTKYGHQFEFEQIADLAEPLFLDIN